MQPRGNLAIGSNVDWSKIASDSQRENYLGHSVHARELLPFIVPALSAECARLPTLRCDCMLAS